MTHLCKTKTTKARFGRDATTDGKAVRESSAAVAGSKVFADKGCSGRNSVLLCLSIPRIRRLTRVPKRVTLFGSIVILASGIGHIWRHPVGDSSESRQIVTSLVEGQATLELLPEGFEDELGYRPIWAEGTLVHPRGACSTPGGVGPDSFETACRVHDFGYDILRYAERRGTRIGPWARFDLDRHLYGDLLRVCDTATCRATATLYYAGVTLNSIRQGYVAPTDEPTVPWAAAAVGVVGLAAAPIERFTRKQATIEALCRASTQGSQSVRRLHLSAPWLVNTCDLLPVRGSGPFHRLFPWRGVVGQKLAHRSRISRNLAPDSRLPGLSERITDTAGASRQITIRTDDRRRPSSLILAPSEHP